jgi:hypothetical protein
VAAAEAAGNAVCAFTTCASFGKGTSEGCTVPTAAASPSVGAIV